MATTKEIVFKTKITNKLLGLFAFPLGSAAALTYFALDANAKFAPSDPTKILFVGIPAFIAAVLFLSVVAVCAKFLNRQITIRGQDLVYQDSKLLITLDIGEMAFSPPPCESLLRALMFSDGSTFVQIPELFLGKKDFERLTKLIKKRRRNARDTVDQKTYSL